MPAKPSLTSAAEQAPIRLSESRLWSRLCEWKASWAVGLGVTADQAVVSLSSFLATVIVGRVCGQHELGVYGLAVSIFWLAAGIPNALVWTPYMARAARLPASRRATFAGSALLHAAAIALVLAGVLLLFPLVPDSFLAGNTWFAPMCVALAPFTVMMLLREHIRRFNLAHLQFKDLLAIDVPIGAVQLTLLLSLAYAGALSAASAMWAIALSCGAAIVWLTRARNRFRFDIELATLHWSHNQRFGRWLVCVSLMWLVGDASYRWLVLMLHGTEVLGQFSAAQNIVLLLNPVVLSVTNLTQATSANRLAKGGVSALRQMAVRSTLLFATWSGAALSVLAAIGGPLVEMIFGETFSGLGAVVATLCLGMFARIVAMPVDGAVIALRRGRLLVVAEAVRLATILAAGVPLIAWRGLEGVGYAMALSAAAGAVVAWWAVCQEVDHA
jgi:O-antigen/teichoic acid export membrane protein